jgi:hypothetical protein
MQAKNERSQPMDFGAGPGRRQAGVKLGVAFVLGLLVGWGAIRLGYRSAPRTSSGGYPTSPPRAGEGSEAQNLQSHLISSVRMIEAASGEAEIPAQARTIEVLEFDWETGDVVGKTNIKVPRMLFGD